ncbi:DNA repair protein [Desulfonema limicola]|uniref:DNA repair protein RecN n=1 Tax=Desulfonema limicola TaxID=45656 RepID=A0A975GF76_9BACT|nr:DNA repair protein RecN [Desulfonema limicola]QTA78972.1 DNA repair protein [Desulfonema limicola]
MLQDLSIKNFAIIDDLQISFPKGFSILSGETGAGKSIIINAVNLLLGSRVTSGFIRTGAETAELEAFFNISPDSRAALILKENDIDPSEGLLVRRIIAQNNRHKIYINNRLSTSTLLNAVTADMASISGQRAHQGLLDENQHLLILDQFGKLMPLREKTGRIYQDIQPLIQKLNRLNNAKERQAEQIELLEFQKNEILEADIKEKEDAELEKELVLLKNGETLYTAVHSGLEELYNAQNAIVERLTEVKKRLEKACQIDPELDPQVEGLADTTFRIEDIADNLRAYLGNIQIDEKRLAVIADRLHDLQKLKRKYGGSLEAVNAHLKSIKKQLAGFENISDEIAQTEEKLAEQCRKLAEIAVQLSEKRRQTGIRLAKKVEKELEDVKMSNTRFEVSLKQIPASESASPFLVVNGGSISETGIDRASFIIAPNIGEDLKPLTAIASGGELSRVVLALKVILAETESVETIIFDEVDAGIGGSVAEVVGQKIAGLGAFHQVLCITHLAQIAKFGHTHFRISKQVVNGRTITSITQLDREARIKEIARMLGGVKMTQATLDHASEMLFE